MAREPFLPLFFGDFLASTSEWEGEERALYLLLLGYQWSLGSLPADLRKLCKVVGWDCDLFERCWPTVSAKFEAVDMMAFAIGNDGERHQSAKGTRLLNRRLEEHRARAADLSGKNSAAGKKGAEARWRAKNGAQIADAMPNHGERHQSANGVTDGNPTQPNPIERTLSPAREVPREALGAEGIYSGMLDDWKRDVPECNPEAFTRWIVHVEEMGKRMNVNMRLMQARRLAGQGEFPAQAEVVAWCIEQGYKTLVPIAEVRQRRDGRAASGHVNGRRHHTPAPTVPQMEADIAAGLRDESGTWIGPPRGNA